MPPGAAPDPTTGDGPGPGGDALARLAGMRESYTSGRLLESDLAADPLAQFGGWLADAVAAGLPEPNAMVLATATRDGQPSTRTVLLKDLDEHGLVFYTNYTSRKGTEISANPAVSLLLPWHAIGRQVVVSGRATRVERAQTEAYFATRPRSSQLGAWASPQSQTVADRETLEQTYAEHRERFAEQAVPAPAHWGGVRVAPDAVEFWQGREGRLHDRLRYRRGEAGWLIERLAP
jgi:pyridoxamine 5'-phosphate oxidase